MKKSMQHIIINQSNDKKNQKKLDHLNKAIASGKHVFLFLFMVGCGPCNATKEPWSQIQNHLENEHLQNPNIILAMIDKDYYSKLMNIGNEPMGFPTLRYIRNGVEDYEDSEISRKDRSAESFADWVKIKVSKMRGGERNNINFATAVRRSPTRRRAGGKWSLKYKSSINCRKPKGFSQRQHCKYGRKKMTRKYRK